MNPSIFLRRPDFKIRHRGTTKKLSEWVNGNEIHYKEIWTAIKTQLKFSGEVFQRYGINQPDQELMKRREEIRFQWRAYQQNKNSLTMADYDTLIEQAKKYGVDLR